MHRGLEIGMLGLIQFQTLRAEPVKDAQMPKVYLYWRDCNALRTGTLGPLEHIEHIKKVVPNLGSGSQCCPHPLLTCGGGRNFRRHHPR